MIVSTVAVKGAGGRNNGFRVYTTINVLQCSVSSVRLCMSNGSKPQASVHIFRW